MASKPHSVVLVLTYDVPIDESTVSALRYAHSEDEGLLRVTGAILR